MVRTVISGLVGALLVTAFAWYSGLLGVVNLGPWGSYPPPEPVVADPGDALQDFIATLTPQQRRVGGDFAPTDAVPTPPRPPRFHTSQLVIKPRFITAPLPSEPVEQTAAEPGDVNGSGDGSQSASRSDGAPVDETPDGVAIAVTAAERYGRVRPLADGAFLLDVTVFGLATAAPLSRDGEAACPDDVTSLDTPETGLEPQDALACVQAQLMATNLFAWVERNHLLQPAAALWMDGPISAPDPTASESATDTIAAFDPRRGGASEDPLAPLQWPWGPAEALAANDEGVTGGGGFSHFWTVASPRDGASSGRSQTGSRDVVVAVLDSGLDPVHPEFAVSTAAHDGAAAVGARAPRGNVLAGADFISTPALAGDGDGRDLDPADSGTPCPEGASAAAFQGTHLAGIIGAGGSNDGVGVAGAAWSVSVAPIRVASRCGALRTDLNDAIRWAAGVAPMALGTAPSALDTADGTAVEGAAGASAPPSSAFDAGADAEAELARTAALATMAPTVLRHNGRPARIVLIGVSMHAPTGCPASTQDAIDAALAAGAVVVASAGVGGVDARSAAPGNCTGVLTVAAGDAAGRLAAYSNYGPRVDILAPGGDMRVDLTGDGRPDGVLSTRRSPACIDMATGEMTGPCSYAYAEGGAQAAAHVAGALALLAAQYPDATGEELIALVVNTARSPRTPTQCPRACGAGLLDLARAAGSVVAN